MIWVEILYGKLPIIKFLFFLKSTSLKLNFKKSWFIIFGLYFSNELLINSTDSASYSTSINYH